jgi:hypothetical protein
MSKRKENQGCVGILLWPFVTLLQMVAAIVKLVGRVFALFIGLVLMIVGAALTLTIVGAVIGVPLAMVGLLLVIRSLF